MPSPAVSAFRWKHSMPFARSMPQTMSASISFPTIVSVTVPTSRSSSGRDRCAVLALQVREVRLRVDRRSHRPPQRLLRRVLATVSVDVLPEPLAQRRELTSFDLLLELAEILRGLLPELHRHDGAEQVGREVAD